MFYCFSLTCFVSEGAHFTWLILLVKPRMQVLQNSYICELTLTHLRY